MQLLQILSNKVVLYMGTRYVTYGVQFLASMLIAFQLGPENFGIWSFFLLIVNFFNIFDFGISNSLNVLLVQDRDNKERYLSHIKSASLLTTSVSLFVLLAFFLEKAFRFEIIDKYNIRPFLVAIVIIVITAYFNKIFATIYRVKNRLVEVAFYQSIIPVFLFLSILFFKNNVLLFLVLSYLVGNLISILIFFLRKEISFKGNLSIDSMKQITSKGLWLFIYNSSFYFILYLSSLLVSINYSVGEYGKYNFSYTLSHSVILLIDAFGFIIFPKMIAKLKDQDMVINEKIIEYIRTNYMTLVHLLVLLVFPFFYLLNILFPQYSNTTCALCFAGLSLLPYADCFGLNTFLIAQNRERILSMISISSLFLNTIFVLFSIYYLKMSFEYIFLCIAISYSIYTFSCSFIVRKMLGKNCNIASTIQYAFINKNIFVFVFSLYIAISFQDNFIFLCLPFLFYIFLNFDKVRIIYSSFRKVILKPNIVDLN